MTNASLILCLLGASIIAALPSSAQEKRPITPADCVTVRELQSDESTWHSTIKISPNGRLIAYAVVAPNLKTNKNDVELYVRKLSGDPADSEKPMLVGEVSAVRWMADSEHLTMLIKDKGRVVVERVNAENGAAQEVLVRADKDVEEYSIDQSGNTIVFATEESKVDANAGPSAQEVASGYRIPFEATGVASWFKRKLHLIRRSSTGWTAPETIAIMSPISGDSMELLPYAKNAQLEPTLSPDGRHLLVEYFDLASKMPVEWRESGFMQLRERAGIIQAFRLLVLYDLARKKTTVPFKTPWVTSAPAWSSDSSSFVTVGRAPVSSALEHDDLQSQRIGHGSSSRLFWIKPASGEVQIVAPQLSYPSEGPLFWNAKGDLLVRVVALNTITRFSHVDGKWIDVSSFQIPINVGTELASDGIHVIGDFNDTETPPQLFAYQVGQKEVHVFAKLNPQFENLTLAHPEEVHWQTSTGFDASGLLLLPIGYLKGTKYPLVIQTKPFGGFFVCSFGNFPSFAPQPIANAGIMYLGSIPTKGSTQREEDFISKGYPGYQGGGGIAEAAFEMDYWDSAVRALERQGLVDSRKVGIIGFSRTGWHTEFILAHSDIHYQAATVADNVQFSLGEYWMGHDAGTFKMYDSTYGGPPYGPTLKNWLDYSISFNLDKIRTPLLMEQMGYGIPYDRPDAPPYSLVSSFEVFSGLNRLSKPVELYYYPNEGHTPEHPQARLATMQRNLDWYCFWLQGYERPSPEDPNQYPRWHKLRDLQQEDAMKNSGASVIH
jgi:hypothetical protein